MESVSALFSLIDHCKLTKVQSYLLQYSMLLDLSTPQRFTSCLSETKQEVAIYRHIYSFYSFKHKEVCNTMISVDKMPDKT